MPLLSMFFLFGLLANSLSCQNPSTYEEWPTPQRQAGSDKRGDQGGGDVSQNKNKPVVPTGSENIADKATNKKTPVPSTPVSENSLPSTNPNPKAPATTGSTAPSTPAIDTQGSSGPGETLIKRFTELQAKLAAFASLVRDKAPAAEGPVKDAQTALSEALVFAKNMEASKDEAEKDILNIRIHVSLATSRSALTRSHTAGLSDNNWPSEVNQAFWALVDQYESIFADWKSP
jgi:hypothetical protein